MARTSARSPRSRARARTPSASRPRRSATIASEPGGIIRPRFPDPRAITTIEVVSFDLDDTLVDAAGAWRSAFAEAFAMMCERTPGLGELGGSDAVFRDVLAHYIVDEHERAGGGEWDSHFVRNAFRRLLADHAEADDTLADLTWDHYQSRWPEYVRLFPDARETLEALRGRCRLALVSNGLARDQRRKIERFGLDSYFEVMVVSEEVELRKPDPAIFHHALDWLGAAPEVTIHVGDNPHQDVAGAHAAGLAGAAWLNRAAACPEAGAPAADIEIRSLAELVDVFRAE